MVGDFYAIMGYSGSMERKTVVIGATNTDIAGMSYGDIVKGDSNIGMVTVSRGGVGHNVALNLAMMGEDVSFITALGSDVYGKEARKEMEGVLDISSSLFLPGRSDVYLHISSPGGEMYAAVNDMEKIREIDAAFIRERKTLIGSASCVIVDANLSSAAIREAVLCSSSPVLADAVSAEKADRLLPSLDKIDVLKPNLMELEHLCGRKILSTSDVIEASRSLLERGLGAVLVTMGEKGSAYISARRTLYCCGAGKKAVNATGAGDSFLSGFAFGMMEWGKEEDALKAGVSAAEITLLSRDTVSPEMSRENVIRLMKEKETYEQIPRLF